MRGYSVFNALPCGMYPQHAYASLSCNHLLVTRFDRLHEVGKHQVDRCRDAERPALPRDGTVYEIYLGAPLIQDVLKHTRYVRGGRFAHRFDLLDRIVVGELDAFALYDLDCLPDRAPQDLPRLIVLYEPAVVETRYGG